MHRLDIEIGINMFPGMDGINVIERRVHDVDEYDALSTLAREVVSVFSPSKHFFLGIGRSPTPLVAFLQNWIGIKKAGSVALSGFRHNFPGSDNLLLRDALSQGQIDGLFDYLDYILPNDNQLNDDAIVVMDVVASGATLVAASLHIDKYFQTRRTKARRVVALALLTGQVSDESLMQSCQFNIESLTVPGGETAPCSLARRMGPGNFYKSVSQFLYSYAPANPLNYPGFNPAFLQFKSLLASRMVNDRSIVEYGIEETSTAVICKPEVVKSCTSQAHAEWFEFLFNSFPDHVVARAEDNRLYYKYEEGVNLVEAASNGSENLEEIFRTLAVRLGKAHWHNVVKIKNYETVCAQRLEEARLPRLVPCDGYMANIHGDLHLGNIILTPNGSLVFIDRMRSAGDMTFDFVFAFHMLGVSIATSDRHPLFLVKAFFEQYFEYTDDKENFSRALRNNFLTFSEIIQTRGDPVLAASYPYARELSRALDQHDDLISFLRAIW